VFLKTAKGKNMPVNVLPTESKFRAPHSEEVNFVYGEHQSHFQTCPDAKKFRNA